MRYPLTILYLLIAIATPAQMPQLIPYNDNGLWGYCDSTGRIVMQPKWEEARAFYHNMAIVREVSEMTEEKRRNGPDYCLINKHGKYIIPPERHWSGSLAESAVNLRLNSHDNSGKWGYIDTNNRVIVPFVFDRRYCCFQKKENTDKGLLLAEIGGKYGVMGSDGNVVIAFEHEEIRELPVKPKTYGRRSRWGKGDTKFYTYYKTKKDGKCGIMDVNGKYTIPPIYKDIGVLNSPEKKPEVMETMDDDLWYKEFRPDSRGPLLYDFFIVTSKSGMGVVDVNNNILVPPNNENVVFETLHIIRKYRAHDEDDHYDIYHPYGDEDWPYMRRVPKGFYSLRNGKWGYRDVDGRLEIPYSMPERPLSGCMNFDSSITFVVGNKAWLFDKKGKLLLASGYNIITVGMDSVVTAYKTGERGENSMAIEYCTLDAKNGYKETGTWHYSTVEVPSLWPGIPSRPFCGSSGFTDEPYIKFPFDTFLQAGILYRTLYQFKNEEPYTSLYTVRGTKADGTQLYGVVNKNRKFLYGPQAGPIPYGGNMPRGLIAVQQNSLYGVVDTKGNTCVAFQKYCIMKVLPHGTGCYAIADTAAKVNMPHGVDEEIRPNSHYIMINEQGQEVPIFHNKLKVKYVNSRWHANALSRWQIVINTDPTGGTHTYLTVPDSNKMIQLMALDGRVLYPAISGQYKKIWCLGKGHFIADGRLIDAGGKELFKGMRIDHDPHPCWNSDYYTTLKTEKGGLSESRGQDLWSINYTIGKKNGRFLISKYGDIYAANLGMGD